MKRSIQWIDYRSNGYCESFNARLRDELLDGEIFFSLQDVRTVIEEWRRHYNAVRRPQRSDGSHQPQRPASPSTRGG